MIDPRTLLKAARRGYARSAALTFLSLFLALATSGQKTAESVRLSDPLPQDTGAAGLRLMLNG